MSEFVLAKVEIEETAATIAAARDYIEPAVTAIKAARAEIERKIRRDDFFLTTLEPYSPKDDDGRVIHRMCRASNMAGVGPMAAVAGAISEFVGEELARFSRELIIENGGDIYIRSARKRIAAIYAGESPLSGKIGLEIEPRGAPVGISTSSGTVGHSLSFGKADAVVVVAPSATLSDAAATALGNLVSLPADIPAAIEAGKKIRGITGIVIIKGTSLGVWGDIRLCETSSLSA